MNKLKDKLEDWLKELNESEEETKAILLKAEAQYNLIKVGVEKNLASMQVTRENLNYMKTAYEKDGPGMEEAAAEFLKTTEDDRS